MITTEKKQNMLHYKNADKKKYQNLMHDVRFVHAIKNFIILLKKEEVNVTVISFCRAN